MSASDFQGFDAAATLRAARARTGLTQRELAHLCGTSQATLSAYESGRKQPNLATLDRLLAAVGGRLAAVEPRHIPTAGELRQNGQRLGQVIALAELLPFTRRGPLRYPRLPAGG